MVLLTCYIETTISGIETSHLSKSSPLCAGIAFKPIYWAGFLESTTSVHPFVSIAMEDSDGHHISID